MGLIDALVLGIVQGLTEFLPISSSAHLLIVPRLLGWDDPGAGFSAASQIGTVAAVLLYFRRDLALAFGGWWRSLRGEGKGSPEARMGWAIFVGTLPILALGLLFQDFIEEGARSLFLVAFSLIAMGLLMGYAQKRASGAKDLSAVTPRHGLLVGLWQCLSLIPGMSRSGSTITGALFNGFDRVAAARFSFLLSVPSVLAAGVYSLLKDHALIREDLLPMTIAIVASFAVGYASIAFLIGFLQKRGIGVFVVYRVALGLLLLALAWSGVLQPVS